VLPIRGDMDRKDGDTSTEKQETFPEDLVGLDAVGRRWVKRGLRSREPSQMRLQPYF